MSAVMPYRNTSALHITSTARCVNRALRSTRIEGHTALQLQSRALWWWSRHGSWSSCNDESVEDKMHKYQKVMRYRYSRALRRRATWDRENSPPQWALRHPGRWLSRAWGRMPISTTEQMQARLKDEETGFSMHDKPWEEAHRDFESFKAAVDRAIAKDPVGFLFGRRLQGPLSLNNSSWTSIARMFDSKESQDSFEAKVPLQAGVQKIKIENLDKSGTSVTAAPLDKNAASKKEQKADGQSYVYDPISGRKVKSTESETETPVSVKKTFLEGLFSEHGVKDLSPSTVPKKSRGQLSTTYETSRSYEYRRLRAATIGNSIETTAEYGGKYKEPANSATDNITHHSRTVPDITDEDPPFVGTAYESSHGPKSSLGTSRSTWLQREGFQSPQSADANVSPPQAASNTESILQPSLDRVHSSDSSTEKRFVRRLQPAVDRIEPAKPEKEQQSRPAPLNMVGTSTAQVISQPARGDLALDVREDLDLLRPSDVRAATKALRITKTEADQAKFDARKELEADYARRAVDASQDDTPTPVPRLSQALVDSSRKKITQHIQKFPDGIVAKTVNSLDAYNDNYKLSVNSTESGSVLQERGQATPGVLEKLPSIFDTRQKQTISAVPSEPSDEVRAHERGKYDTAQELRQANERHAEAVLKNQRNFTQLANTLREVYEKERGVARVESTVADPLDSPGPLKPRVDLSPLKCATVKPGVKRWPYIERYTQEFEPRLVELREQAKMVKRNLYEVKSALHEAKKARAAHIHSRQSMTAHEATEATEANELHRRLLPTERAMSHSKLASHEQQHLEAMRALNIRLKREPHLMEKPVLQPDTLRDTASTEDTSTVLTRSRSDGVNSTPTSPYILLTYNKQSAEVDSTHLDTLMGQETILMDKVNPIVVMGNLNYPAAFVSRFVALESAGYTLVSGGGDLLIFQKGDAGAQVRQATNAALESIQGIKVDIAELRNKIAFEESKSQPPPQSSVEASYPETSKASTVLNDIPDVISQPGTTAPTTPSPTSAHSIHHGVNGLPKKKDRRSHKVRRQEHVFSGTIRPIEARSPPLDSTSAAARSRQDRSRSSTNEQTGFIAGTLRTLRKAVLATVGLGVAAYTIGVVTEGVGAHAQASRPESSPANEAGPRKRLVMPSGQRPGIYSTETSRSG